jgi:hypothetical protein
VGDWLVFDLIGGTTPDTRPPLGSVYRDVEYAANQGHGRNGLPEVPAYVWGSRMAAHEGRQQARIEAVRAWRAARLAELAEPALQQPSAPSGRARLLSRPIPESGTRELADQVRIRRRSRQLLA